MPATSPSGLGGGAPTSFVGAALAALQAAVIAAVNATVPATGTLITAAVPPRTADAGNTKASAALPVGGAWDGAGRLTDGFARADADITCPVDAAGVFYCIHGPSVVAVDAQNPTAAPAGGCIIDRWPCHVVWTAQRAPLDLRDKAYRLAWRGTAGSTVAITTNLDPRPHSASIAIRDVPSFSIGGTSWAALNPIPPGARRLSVGSIQGVGGNYSARLYAQTCNDVPNQNGPATGASAGLYMATDGSYRSVPRFLEDGATIPSSVRIYNVEPSAQTVWLNFWN